MSFVLPQPIQTALQRLTNAGYEAFLVGGSVRDLLRGTVPEDYDITTSATPAQMQAVFAGERVIETGLKHGTLTVLLAELPIEITTYRVDAEYTDHRHPDKVVFTRSLTEDLARRDFTINAMAYHPTKGLVDPFGGQIDLENEMLRSVGEADRRFTEDALRILRGLRFSSVLGFAIESDTAAAMVRQKHLLCHVSAERVAVELKKLLCGKRVQEILCRYAEVLSVVLPELGAMVGFDQKSPYHCYDLMTHTAVTVAHIPPEPALRLAALLHDIGKPDCFTVDESGIGHCYGHAARSAEMADAICHRLKLDRATTERVVRLVHRHDRQIEPTERAIHRALSELTPDGFFDLLTLRRADTAAKASEFSERIEQIDGLERLARNILAQKPCLSVRDLAVDGTDLMAVGIAQGKEMGRLLSLLLKAVIEGTVENEKTALLRYLDDRILQNP